MLGSANVRLWLIADIGDSIIGAGFRPFWWVEPEDLGVIYAGIFEVGLACDHYAPSASVTMELAKSLRKPPKVFGHKSPQYLALLDQSQAKYRCSGEQ